MQEALKYRHVDRQNDIHMIAFLTTAAASTKKQGDKYVPVYKKYEEFFDYEKELKNITPLNDEEKERYKKIAEIVNSRKN